MCLLQIIDPWEIWVKFQVSNFQSDLVIDGWGISLEIESQSEPITIFLGCLTTVSIGNRWIISVFIYYTQIPSWRGLKKRIAFHEMPFDGLTNYEIQINFQSAKKNKFMN